MKYAYEGSNSGYPIGDDDRIEVEPIICELCLERCDDSYELIAVSSSVSIVVCRACSEQDGKDLEEILEFYASHNNIQ